jgi:hypothetical protein
MASGHVNRTNRPNTWLHRPTCKREEKPCQLGAVHTWLKADLARQSAICPLSGAKRTSDDHKLSTLLRVVRECLSTPAVWARGILELAYQSAA